jgi:hypothetical protein
VLPSARSLSVARIKHVSVAIPRSMVALRFSKSALRNVGCLSVLAALGFATVGQGAQSSKTPGGIAIPSGPWEMARASLVDVHYQAGDEADAELYLRFFDSTHQALRTEFSSFPVDALMQAPVRCSVWLHPAASDAINPGSALASTSYGATSYCELHFLAPSAYAAQDRCCTKIGEVRDTDQLHRIAAHEYSTIVLDRITRLRSGWRFHSAPEWFEQGYEEYLGCMLATEHTRAVTLGKYRELVARTPSRLADGKVENPYIDGAVLIEYLHAEFGRQKVQALLSSAANTFDEAFRETFGISQGELFERARLKLRAVN